MFGIKSKTGWLLQGRTNLPIAFEKRENADFYFKRLKNNGLVGVNRVLDHTTSIEPIPDGVQVHPMDWEIDTLRRL